jgi:hypothetical protein
MKSLLSRKQTLWLLALIIAVFLGAFLFAAYQAKVDLNIGTSGQFQLTPAQAYVITIRPIVHAAAYVFVILGIVILAASVRKRPLLAFGLLSLLSGLLCALLIWITP